MSQPSTPGTRDVHGGDTAMLAPRTEAVPPTRSRRAAGRGGLLRMIVTRLAMLPVLVFVVFTVTFFTVNALPADPVAEIAGTYATDETVTQIRQELGLDKGLGERYVSAVANLFQGQFGDSYYTGREVIEDIAQRFPTTLELSILAIFVAIAWGLGIGAVSAWCAGRWPDGLGRATISFQQAMPGFIAGLLLIYFLTFKVKLFPQPTGVLSLSTTPPPRVTGSILIDSVISGRWDALGDGAAHLVLPVVSIAFVASAAFARVSRATFLTALDGQSVEFTRAQGLSGAAVVRDAWTTTRVPVLTMLAMTFGAMIGATAVIEIVFNLNGMASWGVQAITAKDLPAVTGFVTVTATFVLVVFGVLDVLVHRLDPRTRAS